MATTVYVIHRVNTETGLTDPDTEFATEFATRSECLALIRSLRTWQPKVKRVCIELQVPASNASVSWLRWE